MASKANLILSTSNHSGC